MSNQDRAEKRRNKEFILNNSQILREYALQNQGNLGLGIVVINLPYVRKQQLEAQDVSHSSSESLVNDKQVLQKPLSYLPLNDFWFKMVRLKIKNKYEIDIQNDYDLEQKFLFVFIKDREMEHFSIYAVKLV